ncbi:hypothetical protein OS493_040329, partial [Desmophyllum pertusum]
SKRMSEICENTISKVHMDFAFLVVRRKRVSSLNQRKQRGYRIHQGVQRVTKGH